MRIVVVGLEGMMLQLSWIRMQDKVRRSALKGREENYLEFERSPCRLVVEGKGEGDERLVNDSTSRVLQDQLLYLPSPLQPLAHSLTKQESYIQSESCPLDLALDRRKGGHTSIEL